MPEQVGVTGDGGTKFRLSDAETATLREALTLAQDSFRRHGNPTKAAEFGNLAQYAGQVKRVTVVV